MANIKFSVLIPVYNVENFLIECIESVLNQTFQNFEIILINDGSTDSSGVICNKYSQIDDRIKVFHQTNQGLILARRNAIAKATGDFYIFLDSDDFWDTNLLEIINQTIFEYNSDLIIFKFKRVSEKGNFISESESVFKDGMVFDCENKEELFKMIISTSKLNNLVCKAVKNTIVDNNNVYSQYKKLKNAEDLLQSIPLLYNAKSIVYRDKPLYNYREVSTSMTHNFNKNLVRDITTVRAILLQYLKKLKIDSDENLKLYYQFYINSVLKYIYKLINSSIDKEEKLKILKIIKNYHLFVDSQNYIDRFNLSLGKKILFQLVNKSYYKTLFMYVKFGNILKKYM